MAVVLRNRIEIVLQVISSFNFILLNTFLLSNALAVSAIIL